MTSKISLSNGGYAVVDDCDFEFLNQWKWRRSNGYAIRTVCHDGKSYVRRMHRIVADAPDGVQVDHANRDRLDNRRENLRLASSYENVLNRSPSKNRKYKGTYRKKNCNRWEAKITINGKKTYLGLFQSEEDAARAYDEHAIKHFGDFAALNFPQNKKAS